MNKTLIHLTYFPSIAHCIAIYNASDLVLEYQDNYQKQTYRNRTYIYGANGKQCLSVPILHAKNTNRKQYYKDIKIDNSTKWTKNHQKSIDTAYRSTAYYEYYQDMITPIFEKKNSI